MRDDQQRLLIRVQLVDQRLKPSDQVKVRLAVRVARAELVDLPIGAEARVLQSDLLLGEPVLLELDERAEELRVRHHRLRALPRDVLAALQNNHAEAHVLHELVRLRERLELGDVAFTQFLESSHCVFQLRDYLRKLCLTLVFDLLLFFLGHISLSIPFSFDLLLNRCVIIQLFLHHHLFNPINLRKQSVFFVQSLLNQFIMFTQLFR